MTVSSAGLVETPAGVLPASVAANTGAEIIPYPNAKAPPAVEEAAAAPAAGRPASPAMERLRAIASSVLPTLLMIVALLTVWEIACSGEGASLPGPSRIWAESYEVIVDP